MLKFFIKNVLSEVVEKEYGIEMKDGFNVEKPEDDSLGDYATNIAFLLSKRLKRDPKQVSLDLIEKMKRDAGGVIEDAQVGGPGFINIFISREKLFEYILKAIENVENFRTEEGKRYGKIILEFVSANPTGPLHIGHGRWGAIGDSIARAMSFHNFNVFREYYINDAGRQIELLYKSIEAVRNKQPIPEDGYHGEYIEDLAKSENIDPLEEILHWHKEDLKKFRVDFDSWFSEKQNLRDTGLVEDTIKLLQDAGYIYEKDSALWFASTRFGDDKDRVVRKSDGEYTYFAVDIAYHRTKLERGFDVIINVFGADHHGYIKRLDAAIKALKDVLGIKKPVELRIIIGQLVFLYRNGEPVRLSKRAGNIITLKEVLDEVGPDPLRYFLVSKKVDTPIDFDIELAKKQSEENPVYYLQYAHARLCGILRNAEEKLGLDPSGWGLDRWKQFLTPEKVIDSEEARSVAVEIARFPEEVWDVATSLEPHRMVLFLHRLATKVHKFYHIHKVLDASNVDRSINRLGLIVATKNVLAKALEIIGVSAPEKM